MLAETFLKEFAPLVSTTNGIQKLRELVLQLAMRGKLVPQETFDGSASDVAEKALQEVPDRIKRQLVDASQPHPIPKSWVWVPLGAISNYGETAKVDPDNIDDPDFWILELEDIEKSTSRLLARVPFRERNFRSSKNRFKEGQVLYGKLRPYLDKVIVADRDGCCTTEIVPFSVFGGIDPYFIRWCMKTPDFISYADGSTYGMNLPRMGTKSAIVAPIPLPPIAEQRRIVAKVDELMLLCDDLEAQQAKETELKRATAASALHQLTEAKTPEEIAGYWSLLVPRFDELFNDLETIKALREGVLDFAVRGVLTNSSAHNSNSSFPVRNFYMLHVPDEWQIVELKECCSLITDGTHQTPKYTTKGRIFLSAKNVKPFRFLPDDHKFVSQADFEKYREKRRPEKGDVLLTRVGSNIGEAAVIDSDLDFAIYVSLALLKPKREVLRSDFLALWLNSPVGTATAIEKTYGRGMSQGNLNLGQIRGFRIALPPLAEQKRIVAKVDELMALCDQLEEQVRESERLNAELMATLIHSLIGTDLDHGGMPEPGGFAADAPAISSQKQANTDLGAPRTENIRNALSLEPGTRLTSDRAPSVDTKFQEAVLVAAIVKTFFEAGGEPIGNFRLQKAVYFARRRMGEHVSEMAYLRKAAGPYNPSMKYSGGIAIAKQKNWLHEARGRYGFGHVPGADIVDAEEWIATYRYDTPSRWVTEHFRYKKNEEWETLATVDYVIEHLQTLGIEPDPAQILQYIASDLEWRPKIEKLRLTEISVATAKLEVQTLFSTEGGDK